MNDIGVALRDISSILEQLGLTYAVVGGVAVRAYGIPRPTFDLDFMLAISRDCLDELFQAAEDHGYTVPETDQSGWVDEVGKMPLIKIRCDVQHKGVDVDIFIAETPYQQEILNRRQRIETPDGETWLASPEDIVLLKLVAFRPRDRVDISDVFFAQGELDRDYMRRWSKALGVTDRLDKVLKEADEML